MTLVEGVSPREKLKDKIKVAIGREVNYIQEDYISDKILFNHSNGATFVQGDHQRP